MTLRYLIPTLLIAVVVLSTIAVGLIGAGTTVHAKVIVLKTHSWWSPPPAGSFNPASPHFINIVGLVFEKLAQWIKVPNTFVPILAVGWKYVPEKHWFVVYLRKNVYWHDNYPFTCKDVWTTFMIYKAMGKPVWNYISDVKCLNNYTVVFVVKKWGYLVPWYILWQNGEITFPYHIYGKWAEEIAKATSKSQMQSILKSLLEYQPKTLIGTGPFKLETITSNEVVLVKFDKYWNAKNVYIDEIIMPKITSNQIGWQYYRTGGLDFDIFMMPPSLYNWVQHSSFARVVKIYDLSGCALVFNFRNKWLANREVRVAIALAINRTKVALAGGVGMYDPSPYPTDLIALQINLWVKPLVENGVLNPYKYNPQEAAKILESLGFKKVNGVWYTPDGKPFKLTLIAPGGWTDWVAMATEVAQQLKNFGIQVELKTPPAPAYWSSAWYLGGHYDLALDFYGAWMVYPYKAMKRTWIEVNGVSRKVVQGPEFPTVVYLPYFHKKVNVTQLVQELASTMNPSLQHEIAEELAYAVNYYLPELALADKHLLIYLNIQHFLWPDWNIKYNYYNLYQNAGGGHLEALALMIKLGYVRPNPSYWGVSVPPLPKICSLPSPAVAVVPTTTTVTKTTAVTVTTTTAVTKTTTVAVTKTATVSAPSGVKVVTVTVTKPVVVTKTTVSPVTVTKYVASPAKVSVSIPSGLLYGILAVSIIALIGAWVAAGVAISLRKKA
ncbi:MAG: ABC transporter substrate-binding protein [Crenarchaeota archaeon]|nr:ABC transporter substrate-binding protein [Thermoproteota archaeon]